MTENEARQMEVEIKWNGRANVCVHCGKVPETYYITTGHDHTDDSIRYCFCRSVAPSIEQLQAKVAELEEENARLKVESHEADVADSYKDQLAKAEQRVAEACALQVATDTKFRWLDAARVAKEIRSGEWRKFVKEV